MQKIAAQSMEKAKEKIAKVQKEVEVQRKEAEEKLAEIAARNERLVINLYTQGGIAIPQIVQFTQMEESQVIEILTNQGLV